MPSPGQRISGLQVVVHCRCANKQVNAGSQGSSSSQSNGSAGTQPAVQSRQPGHDEVAQSLQTLPGPQVSQLSIAHDGVQVPVANTHTLPGLQSSWEAQPFGVDGALPPPPELSGSITTSPLQAASASSAIHAQSFMSLADHITPIEMGDAGWRTFPRLKMGQAARRRDRGSRAG